jgi:hypothetical protein
MLMLTWRALCPWTRRTPTRLSSKDAAPEPARHVTPTTTVTTTITTMMLGNNQLEEEFFPCHVLNRISPYSFLKKKKMIANVKMTFCV